MGNIATPINARRKEIVAAIRKALGSSWNPFSVENVSEPYPKPGFLRQNAVKKATHNDILQANIRNISYISPIG